MYVCTYLMEGRCICVYQMECDYLVVASIHDCVVVLMMLIADTRTCICAHAHVAVVLNMSTVVCPYTGRV